MEKNLKKTLKKNLKKTKMKPKEQLQSLKLKTNLNPKLKKKNDTMIKKFGSDEPEIEEFLSESNAIEGEYSIQALDDAKKAWDYAYKNCKNITVEYILEIHKLLMNHLDPEIAGKVRDCAVMIGFEVKKKKPEKVLLAELKQWCDEYNKMKKEKGKLTEKDIKEFHKKYEYAHVHTDGNGRVGRILWQIQRLNNGLPIKIIHEGKQQHEYYNWFK